MNTYRNPVFSKNFVTFDTVVILVSKKDSLSFNAIVNIIGSSKLLKASSIASEMKISDLVSVRLNLFNFSNELTSKLSSSSYVNGHK